MRYSTVHSDIRYMTRETCNGLEGSPWLITGLDRAGILGGIEFTQSQSWLSTQGLTEDRVDQRRSLLGGYVGFRRDMAL